MTGLIDTGAAMIMMQQTAYRRLQRVSRRRLGLARTPFRLHGITGNAIRTLGTISISVEVGTASYPLQCIVTEDQNYDTDILIGMNFVTRNGWVIDPQGKMVRCNTKVHPVYGKEVDEAARVAAQAIATRDN